MAAAISLRSYLLVTPFAPSERIILLAFPDISLNHTWNIDHLPWAAFSNPTKIKRFKDRVTVLDPELLEAIAPHVSAVSPQATKLLRQSHQSAAAAFLYLLLSLGSPSFRPSMYTLRSTIPIAAGLGSSASISVCMSAAILHQIEHLRPPCETPSKESMEEMMNIINQWAFVGELCMHGNPSGIDNTVSTWGNAVLFRRPQTGEPASVTLLDKFPVLPLLIVNTKQARSTAVQVAKVAALKETYPSMINPILDAIGKITEAVYALLTLDDFDVNDSETMQRLGEMTRANHGLLVTLGVSHPKLERIRELIDHAGIGWTKLTGAGGGGCAFTILKREASPEVLHRLEGDLDAEGFARYSTLLGGEGVGLLKPVCVRGQEITQGKFLKASGSKRVERLVGDSRGEKSEWNYWASWDQYVTQENGQGMIIPA